MLQKQAQNNKKTHKQ